MKWLIIEDALSDLHGHFLDFVTTFVRGLNALGDKVTVLCARGASATVIERTGALPVMPAAHLRLGSLRNPVELLRNACWICSSLGVLLRNRKLIDGSDLIFLTAVRLQHLILWRLYTSLRGKRFSTPVIFFFMATPIRKKKGGVGYEWEGILGRWVGSLVKSLSASLPLKEACFATETEELSSCLSELCGVRFETIPQPVDPAMWSSADSRHATKQNTITIGSFGPPREEKGSHLLIRAIANLLKRGELGDIRFVVQWTNDFVCSDGTLAEIPAPLRGSDKFNVIAHYFEPGEYEKVLGSVDAVILPYGPNYDLRGSRVLIDALVNGLPVAVTKGTSMETPARRFGKCAIIGEWTQSACEQAIRDLAASAQERGGRANSSTKAAREYFSVKTVRDYVGRRLGANEQDAAANICRSEDLSVVGAASADSATHPATRRKGILLKGYYGNNNAGDDLLFVKIVEQIPDCLQVTATGKATDFGNLCGHRSGVLTKPVGSILSRTLDVLKNDALLLGGGGLFPNKEGTLGQYLELIVALVSGKRIVISGISINPGKIGWEKWLWRLIARHAKFLSVRDRESASVFGTGRATNSVVIGVDTLLSGFPRQQVEAPDALTGVKDYAVFVPAWFPAVISGPMGQLRANKLAEEFRKAIQVAVELGKRPLVVSFYPDDDEKILQLIAKKSPQATVLRYGRDFDVAHVMSVMQGASLCVCMRFHAFVAAVLAGRPSIVVAYDHKFTSLVSSVNAQSPVLMFGISDKFCFGITKDLELDALANTVRAEISKQSDVDAGIYPGLSQVAQSANGQLAAAMASLQ